MSHNAFQLQIDSGVIASGTGSPRLLPTAPVIIVILLLSSIPTFSAEIVHDFRSADFDSKRFRLEGPQAQQFIKAEAAGLHWKFPGKAPDRPVGVYWNSRVHGDFAITVRYEIEHIERPTKGNGVGVELYLMFDGPTHDGVALSRIEPSEGDPLIKLLHLAMDESGKRATRQYQRVATTPQSMRGRLRLVHEGTTLVAAWSEGDQPEFLELQRFPVPDTEIRMARFAGLSGGDTDARLDLRLLEYRLDDPNNPTEQVVTIPAPVQTAEAPAPRPAPRPSTEIIPSRYRTAMILIGVVCLSGAAVVWLITRVSRSFGSVASHTNSPLPRPPARSMASIPSSEISLANALPASSKVRFTCSICGKALKVSADMIGKQTRCPGCGKNVLVSSEPSS